MLGVKEVAAFEVPYLLVKGAILGATATLAEEDVRLDFSDNKLRKV